MSKAEAQALATQLVDMITEIAMTADTPEDRQQLAYNAFAYLAGEGRES